MPTRAFDDVRTGETFGPIEVPVTRDTLVAYANASGDQNPIHQNESIAVSVGLPNVIAHGMWTMGATGAVLAEWVGDAGRIREFTTRFTKPVVVPAEGSRIEVTGTVKSLDPATRTVVVEATTTADGAKVLGRCLATVALD